ncbi:hypothetical protein HDU83_003150 [Entophlyctis luteolus]|nr:hypothetical protein HDU83_003150 [Entophlyctis luteolus]
MTSKCSDLQTTEYDELLFGPPIHQRRTRKVWTTVGIVGVLVIVAAVTGVELHNVFQSISSTAATASSSPEVAQVKTNLTMTAAISRTTTQTKYSLSQTSAIPPPIATMIATTSTDPRSGFLGASISTQFNSNNPNGPAGSGDPQLAHP